MTKTNPSNRGGAREGAGRPTKPEGRKLTIGICISADARTWLQSQPGSLSATVERLIRAAMK